MKHLILVVVLILPVMVQAADLISEAEALQEEARDKLYAWVSTSRLIEEAKMARASGDTDKSNMLAARAIKLANASLAQATKEASSWEGRARVVEESAK